MVDEGFRFTSPWWDAKYLENEPEFDNHRQTYMGEDFFYQTHMLRFIEASIETHNTPASFQTISCHFQLIHCMDILYMELDARPIGSLRSPHIKIFMTPCFKIKSIVTII